MYKQKKKGLMKISSSWKHVTFMLCRSSQLQQMLNYLASFGFCILKNLANLAHEKMVKILGGHG